MRDGEPLARHRRRPRARAGGGRADGRVAARPEAGWRRVLVRCGRTMRISTEIADVAAACRRRCSGAAPAGSPARSPGRRLPCRWPKRCRRPGCWWSEPLIRRRSPSSNGSTPCPGSLRVARVDLPPDSPAAVARAALERLTASVADGERPGSALVIGGETLMCAGHRAGRRNHCAWRASWPQASPSASFVGGQWDGLRVVSRSGGFGAPDLSGRAARRDGPCLVIASRLPWAIRLESALRSCSRPSMPSRSATGARHLS